MTELNRHTTPSGGWQFRDAALNWKAPTPVSSTFDQTVMLIIQARKKNPAITAKYKLATSKEAVESELEKFTRKRLGLPLEATRLPFPVSHRPQGAGAAGAVAARMMSAVEGIKRAAQGTAVVMDWLMSGGQPVAQELADKRGEICVKCPRNVPGAWYTESPAEIIRTTLEARKDLKLETANDAKLKSCDVCKCLLRLKTFVPLHYIVSNTKPHIMSEFPPNCWIARRDK